MDPTNYPGDVTKDGKPTYIYYRRPAVRGGNWKIVQTIAQGEEVPPK